MVGGLLELVVLVLVLLAGVGVGGCLGAVGEAAASPC